jgi:hypothetical protein
MIILIAAVDVEGLAPEPHTATAAFASLKSLEGAAAAEAADRAYGTVT